VQTEFAADGLQLDRLDQLAMAALGLGVDVRAVTRPGPRVTLAVTMSLIFLGIASYALIRATGMP
jgi:uncharacterized membrane protein YadS